MIPFKQNDPQHEPQGQPDDHAHGPSPGELHDELRACSELIDQLTRERDEAIGAHKHALADYANYQRRAIVNERVAREQGAGSVAIGVANVIDHFDVALASDLSKASPEQIVSGMRAIREELIKALAQHGVNLIQPATGEEFVPGRHEAITQMDAPGVGPGLIAQTFQAGYALRTESGERVLRPAKVAVTPGG